MAGDTGHERNLTVLRPGTVLDGRYRIASAREEGIGDRDELGSGGFSIVYLAFRERDGETDRNYRYAIKEYFPAALAVRDPRDRESVAASSADAGDAYWDGLSRFRAEARSLRALDEAPGVVSCVDDFAAGGTWYLVMAHHYGMPLSSYLRREESSGRALGEAGLLALAKPLLEGLGVAHRSGVLHRDVKPANVFLRREDDALGLPARPMLIDFGAAKQDYLRRTRSSGAPHTPGYAAWEQVSGSKASRLTPATDLYGFGALLWRIVAGGAPDHPGLSFVDESGARAWSPEPPDVSARMDAAFAGREDPMPSATALGSGRFPARVLSAIDRCLMLRQDDRPQSSEELLSLLLTEDRTGLPAGGPGSDGTDDDSEECATGVPPAPGSAVNIGTMARRLRRGLAAFFDVCLFFGIAQVLFRARVFDLLGEFSTFVGVSTVGFIVNGALWWRGQTLGMAALRLVVVSAGEPGPQHAAIPETVCVQAPAPFWRQVIRAPFFIITAFTTVAVAFNGPGVLAEFPLYLFAFVGLVDLACGLLPSRRCLHDLASGTEVRMVNRHG